MVTPQALPTVFLTDDFLPRPSFVVRLHRSSSSSVSLFSSFVFSGGGENWKLWKRWKKCFPFFSFALNVHNLSEKVGKFSKLVELCFSRIARKCCEYWDSEWLFHQSGIEESPSGDRSVVAFRTKVDWIGEDTSDPKRLVEWQISATIVVHCLLSKTPWIRTVSESFLGDLVSWPKKFSWTSRFFSCVACHTQTWRIKQIRTPHRVSLVYAEWSLRGVLSFSGIMEFAIFIFPVGGVAC